MKERTRRNISRAAQGLSFVLHPFVLPTYMAVALLFSGGMVAMLPAPLRWYMVGVVAIDTLLLPAVAIFIMCRLNLLGDLRLSTRRERMVPLMVVALCYILCAYMLSDLTLAFLVRKFIVAGFSCVVLALAVTVFWQISLHLTAMGGVVAMLTLVCASGVADAMAVLCLAVLAAGLLASARLWLGRHDLWQVAAGFVGGFLVASAAILCL